MEACVPELLLGCRKTPVSRFYRTAKLSSQVHPVFTTFLLFIWFNFTIASTNIGCDFHFKQVVKKNSVKHGLLQIYKKDVDMQVRNHNLRGYCQNMGDYPGGMPSGGGRLTGGPLQW